jgi:hypothetical protein
MKTNNKDKFTLWRMLLIGFFFLLFLIHFPFFNADADISIASGSRGAWTDEGLYSAPIRNFIVQRTNSFFENNSISKTPYFIITPLFSIYLFPFFKFFGISLFNARITILLTCILLFLLTFLKKNSIATGIVFGISTLTFFPVFQYSHLCLAEIISTSLIVFAIFFYGTNTEPSKKSLNYFFVILILSVLFKFQFIYILAIPIIFSFVEFVSSKSSSSYRTVLFSVFFFLFWCVCLYFIWFLPFKFFWVESFKASSGRISLANLSIEIVINNISMCFASRNYLLFTILFLISLVTAFIQIVNGKVSEVQKRLTFLSFIWFLIEFHKFGLVYLPIRYLISLFVSMGLFSSIVISSFFSHFNWPIKSLFIFSIVLCFVFNIFTINKAFSKRCFEIYKTNVFLSQETRKNDVIIGPWASTLSWGTNCVSYPVWQAYVGNKDLLKYYKPNFIISEPLQEDSDSAYFKSKIYLENIGDSLKQAKIALWKINIYRLKKK